VISETGEQLGMMTPKEALEIANDRGLDLVEVAPESDPPVCRIMDWGKFQYDQSKKMREAAKSHTTIQIKEIRLRPKIEEHDFNFKLRHAKKFLEEHNKVKVICLFRGRELIHQELGLKLLERFAGELAGISVIEYAPKLEGRLMTMVLGPKTGKKHEETKQTAGEEPPPQPVENEDGVINA
jgi:translation initiation factor IF-3